MGHSQVDIFIDEKKIKDRVIELGKKISKDFAGQELSVLCVLKGSFIFCADLMRATDLKQTVEFIGLSSYGDQISSSGKVTQTVKLTGDISGKNVLVVEDIVDTGLTLETLIKDLKLKNPKSLKIASLLFKPSKLETNVKIDYLGFEIEDKFVIGYGLDFAGHYRELPYIGVYRA